MTEADMWAYKREVDPLNKGALAHHLPVVASPAHLLAALADYVAARPADLSGLDAGTSSRAPQSF